MITNEQIRANLIDAIKHSHITQSEIAQKVGIIQQSVSQYISGRAMPTLETFANLCVALDLDANEILGIK
ncbi:MAG: helix-turn-helix domain-containing protein [Clostridia bacterium]|nr:helix-turn-helix domain-containing protein [Clostridia bacterium]